MPSWRRGWLRHRVPPSHTAPGQPCRRSGGRARAPGWHRSSALADGAPCRSRSAARRRRTDGPDRRCVRSWGTRALASAKPQPSAWISASATGPMLPSSVLSKVEQYLKKNCRHPARRSQASAARLCCTASRTGAVRDFSATTTASASSGTAVSDGTPMSCTVRMPPRTSIEQRSVAPVKSSAMAPSSMVVSSNIAGMLARMVTPASMRRSARRLRHPRAGRDTRAS